MSTQDLLAYTLSNAGILHCFLRDLWTLRREHRNGETIFWLNEVPCVSITVVGLVVGIKLHENYTLISVDDGSAVVDTKLPHKCTVRMVETKSKDGKHVDRTESKSMEPICSVPQIGNTVKVLAKLGYASRPDQEQPMQISIKDILVCDRMEEAFHWTRVIQLHNTKYSQPFILPTASYIPLPIISVPSTPQKVQPTLDDQATPKAARYLSTPAPSVSPESVHSYAVPAEASNSMRMPRLRHPSRLRSSQLSLETFQTHFLYYMTCMDEHIRSLNTRDNSTPTKQMLGRKVGSRIAGSDDDDDEPDDYVGFGLGYLMRVPELQSLAIRVVKAERKAAEKRKILQERENLQRGSAAKPLDGPSRSKKQSSPSSLKKDTKRLFERVISSLFHNGAIVIEEGKSRKWDHDEAQLVNSLQFWKHKTGDTQSQYAESTIISEVSLTSTGGDDELQLSDVDEGEDAYIPVTPRLLHEPVMLAIKHASKGRRHTNARTKAQGAAEEDILQELKFMDARWDHISNISMTLQQLEAEDAIWEVSRGVWVAH